MSSVMQTGKERKFPIPFISFRSQCIYLPTLGKQSFSLIPQIQMLISAGNNRKDTPTYNI